MRSSTPILDLEAPLPASRNEVTSKGLVKALPTAIGLIALIPAAMFLIFGVGGGVSPWLAEIFLPVLGTVDGLFQEGPLVAIPVMWLAMFLTLVAHEAGHVIAARFNGWSISEFRAFPFSIQKNEGSWKLRVSLRLWPGGLVVAHPPTCARFHSKIRVYALGGPMMNLATGILVLLTPFAPKGSMLSASESLFMIWSFITGFVNLLPLHIRDLELDGYVALIVGRNPQALSMRLAAMKMRRYVLSGKPLGSMNRRWVALAEASGRLSLQNRSGAWLAYAYWLQQRQLDRAALMLERMLQTSGDALVNFKALLFAECSVLAALRGQKTVAQAWKDRASEFFLPEYLRCRSNSYVAWSGRDFEAAYREAVLAKDAVLKLDANTQKAFLPSWIPWIEALDKARTPMAELIKPQATEMILPYT